MRGQTAIVGIGKLPWYKRGTAPDSELKMAVEAVVAAADDARVDPRDIDGFVSWGSEINSGTAMMQSLGTRELRYGALVWMHGGGSSGSIGLAAQAVATGQADYVVVIRSMAEKGPESRLSRAVYQGFRPPHLHNNGLTVPAQTFALNGRRVLEGDGLPRNCVRDFVLASYHHARQNPDAFAYGNEIDADTYEASRQPTEPLHLYDNSRENDCAIALLVTSAERARDLAERPAYILASTMGRYGGKDAFRRIGPDGHTTAGFRSAATRCWQQSGYGPSDVDVVQVYSNAATAAIVGLIDHGFCTWDDVDDVVQFDNLIAPDGGLPINTSGGDLGDGFLHGAGNNIEAVRQIRGTSSNQVPGASLSLVMGGPNDQFVSTTLLGTEETL
jgi:acetyl-CoA acetyltransferase